MTELKSLIEAARRGDAEQVRTILQDRSELINKKDDEGATALHYAAFGGHRDIVRLLVENGADINARDNQFGATPAGWAIEYLREFGGFLGIELADFCYAIERCDVEWIKRLLQRFPALRQASYAEGKPFTLLAEETRNPEIVALFRPESNS